MSHAAPEDKAKTPLLSNQTYDIIKWIAQYFLPAAGALYSAVGLIWGFENVVQVVGTITALDVFLGALLGFSKKSYVQAEPEYDGAAVITAEEDGHPYLKAIHMDGVTIDDLVSKDAITLKVTNEASSQV